jgi:hypothetical protein
VCDYSSLATLVVVFKIVLLVSVVSNKYLHYSYNYVLVMLSIRSVLVTIITEHIRVSLLAGISAESSSLYSYLFYPRWWTVHSFSRQLILSQLIPQQDWT